MLFIVVNKETISMVVSRQFVTDIVAALDDLKPCLVKEVAKALLNIVQSRLISYEEQVMTLYIYSTLFFASCVTFLSLYFCMYLNCNFTCAAGSSDYYHT